MPKENKIEREDLIRFYHSDGFVYEIRDDPDGLGLVELLYRETAKADPMAPEHALEIGKALVEVAEKRLREVNAQT